MPSAAEPVSFWLPPPPRRGFRPAAAMQLSRLPSEPLSVDAALADRRFSASTLRRPIEPRDDELRLCMRARSLNSGSAQSESRASGVMSPPSAALPAVARPPAVLLAAPSAPAAASRCALEVLVPPPAAAADCWLPIFKAEKYQAELPAPQVGSFCVERAVRCADGARKTQKRIIIHTRGVIHMRNVQRGELSAERQY